MAHAVGHDLELNVAGVLEVLLHVDLAVAEELLGLAAREVDGVLQVLRIIDDVHAASAAAARCLDDDREADPLGDLYVLLLVGADGAVRARDGRNAGVLHGLDGGDLVSHQPDALRGGAHEDEAGALDLLGEVGVLGEEAVAGVDGLSACNLSGRDDSRDVEVGLLRGGASDADRLVGELHMLEVAVSGRVDRNRLDAHLLAGPEDAQRNFAAVRDDQLFNLVHALPPYSRTNSGWSYSTMSPLETRTFLMVPDLSAVIWFIIFMASTMQSGSPLLIDWPSSTNGFWSGAEER